MAKEKKSDLELFLEEMVENEEGLLSSWQVYDLKRSMKHLNLEELREVVEDEEE